MTIDASATKSAEELDPVRLAQTTIEPYPHDVLVTANDVVLGRTQKGLLLRETYAPDIYIPAADISLDRLSPSKTETYCPYKSGTATHFHAHVDGKTVTDIAWLYRDPLKLVALKGYYAFDFDKVRIEVDGQLVRGHVRDPHKTITVASVDSHLRMEIAGKSIVDSNQALLLKETGLPARYYVPTEHIDANYLVASERHSVCTYKGEATYHHLNVEGRLLENVVWTYPEPWTDFSKDVGKIAGYCGVYASAFDRIFLGQEEWVEAAMDAEADLAMIAAPTVDQVLREKTENTA